jgi:hypothetical protein
MALPAKKEPRSGRLDHHPLSLESHPLDPAHNRRAPKIGGCLGAPGPGKRREAREAAALYEDRPVGIYRVLGGHT